MSRPVLPRAEAREELGSRHFDLLVIGGGIVGAGVAHEAARAGLVVALVDRGDFGGATSGASSKLIHGGLGYLPLGNVRLVREAHRERRALMRVVAPHLVRPLRFLVPLYRDGPYRRVETTLGLWAYSTLAGERLRAFVGPERARASVPDLRVEGLHGCGAYSDAWTHDSRLSLLNVRAAAEAGATVLNHAEVVALGTEGGRAAGGEIVDRLDGLRVSVSARAIVNATGPWLDRVRRLEDPDAEPAGRLSKGVHVLVPLEQEWRAALTIPHDRVRVTFAYPWEGMLLLGTTDDLYKAEPDELEVRDEDVDQVLSDAAVAVAPEVLRRERVRAAFAGLRVLPHSGGDTVRARRETVFLEGKTGVLSIAGGKLTTYRRIALSALARVGRTIDVGRLDLRAVPLPGATGIEDAARELAEKHPELPWPTRAQLVHLYGSLALEVVGLADGRPELLRPMHPKAPEIWAQVVYAKRHEWAASTDDVLWRRTTLGPRGLGTPDVVARIETLLSG